MEMEIEKAIELVILARIRFLKEPEKYEALYIAREALEKQVPKKPICEYDDEFTCPCCGTTTEDYDVTTLKYCSECGQKLDWEETND